MLARRKPLGVAGLLGKMRPVVPLALAAEDRLVGPPAGRPAAVLDRSGMAFGGTAAALLPSSGAGPPLTLAAPPTVLLVIPAVLATVPLAVFWGRGTGVSDTAAAATDAGSWPDGSVIAGGRGPRASGASMTRTPWSGPGVGATWAKGAPAARAAR